MFSHSSDVQMLQVPTSKVQILMYVCVAMFEIQMENLRIGL